MNNDQSTRSSSPNSTISNTITPICVTNNTEEQPTISDGSSSNKSRSISTTMDIEHEPNGSKSHSKINLKSINKIFTFSRRDHNKNKSITTTTSPNHKSSLHCNSSSNDQFFIKFDREQRGNNGKSINDLVLNDQRRIVWISLLGLYNSWKQCPSVILYSSIFLLPLKQKWIYSPIKYQQEIQNNIVGNISIFKGRYSHRIFCVNIC